MILQLGAKFELDWCSAQDFLRFTNSSDQVRD